MKPPIAVPVSIAACVLALVAAVPSPAAACACGCGVFEVGSASMFPTRPGGTFSLEYDLMDQSENWKNSAPAPAVDNADKEIRSSFVTAAARCMVSRAWGLGLEVPYWNRRFRTAAGDGGILDHSHSAVGDVRVRGDYAGFSDDLSTGLTAGLKLATGDHGDAHFDRDTEIGTGSTDLLLGAYHIGPLTADRRWTWFADGQWARPFATSGDYRPGAELDVTAAVSHAGGRLAGATVAPRLEVIAAVRSRDSGAEANPEGSGYSRVLVAPGFDARALGLRTTVSLALPVFERVHGDQLVAPVLARVVVARAL